VSAFAEADGNDPKGTRQRTTWARPSPRASGLSGTSGERQKALLLPFTGGCTPRPPTIPKGARQSHHRHTTFDTYAHLMLGATTSFGSGWTPISEVRRPRSRHEGCSPGTRFAWRNAFRALLLLGQWSSDGPHHSDAGGHSPSGWPTSHSWPNGSSNRPRRQPCSFPTGPVCLAPAATAAPSSDSGSSTTSSIRPVAPPIGPDHYQIDTIVSIVCEHTTATSISTRQSNNQEGDRAWR
jgi:hypothetical protein